ncbi:hypothetical protein J5U23_01412 [Saccharolobus shibatae B12]|uniref:Uncharacterized protein n=1 Tax=Saccharolobus shibatae (strain ATCC 51178 / DSM 5389 / JCM 8931 / NBRC 15437 / B12) TaxID=523848 RepID=A0A8F5GT37_SACSH|nr:hypothetical protein J5U23_01412 [Saccharolobus shibatae B12]
MRDRISQIEILDGHMLINKEIRMFSCTDEPYFDDNLLLALDISERAKKLGWKFENGLWINGKVKFLIMLGLIIETFNYNIYYIGWN